MSLSASRFALLKSARVCTARPAVRAFSRPAIPTNDEQATGELKKELDEAKAGRIAFNRDPIVPAANAGTKENPILVPSGLAVRGVGFEDPSSHQIQWFNLHRGALHYIPSIGLYFKLQPI